MFICRFILSRSFLSAQAPKNLSQWFRVPKDRLLSIWQNLPINTGTSISLPSAQLDRSLTIHAYFGNNPDSFGLDKCRDIAATQFTTAEIALDGSADDAAVSMTAHVTFVYPVESDTYAVEFFVVADGLTDPDWKQKLFV